MLGETLVVVAIVLPAICGVGAPGRRPDAGATIAGLAAAAALLVVVVVDEPVRMLGGWVVVDRVGGMWLLFVVFTTAVVRRFAAGSLGADDRWARFLRTTALAGAASAFLMVAGNLWALTVASVVSGLAATTVIRRGSPVAASAVATRAQRTFFVGDAALLVATIVLVSNVGSAEFASLGEASGAAREWGALLLVLAALVRCAQLPSHGWLVQSLSAPTPTSAFLHAGVVNGGGVILIRTARLGTGATLATIACVVITTVGLVVAAAVMRVRADVKGRLVWSTIGQMGFMLLQAALGLTAAAALHLVAHGMYKSNLFLNSGTGLEHRPHHRIARPTGPGGVIAGGAAVVVVGAAVLISGFSPRGNDGGNLLIVGFGVLTVYALLRGGFALRRSLTPVVTLVAAVGAATAVYFLLLTGLESWLDLPITEVDGAGVIAVAVLAVCLVGAWVTRPTAGSRDGGFVTFVDARVRAIGRAPHLPRHTINRPTDAEIGAR